MAPPARDPSTTLAVVRSLDEAREPWQALQEASGRLYSTWEWADAWWRAHDAGRAPAIGVLRSADGAPVAVLPAYRADRGPLALLRLLGHGVSGELGLVCAPADGAAAAAALRRLAAQELPRRGLLVADRLRGDDPVPAALAGTVVRSESTPVLPRDGRTFDEWLASRSSNFRQQVRRRERKLQRDHGLTYRLADDRARLDADFDVLLRLHRARWTGGASSAFTPTREAFHRDFAHRAFDRGWLRLWFAEIGGVAVAAWHGFRFGGSEWYVQAGRDPAWEHAGVGLALLVHTVRTAFDDGVDAYRFGVGEASYKERFASDDPGLQTVVVGSRPAERLARAAAQGARRLPDGPRTLLRRRAG